MFARTCRKKAVFSQRPGCHKKKNKMACTALCDLAVTVCMQTKNLVFCCIKKYYLCNEANKHISERFHFSQGWSETLLTIYTMESGFCKNPCTVETFLLWEHTVQQRKCQLCWLYPGPEVRSSCTWLYKKQFINRRNGAGGIYKSSKMRNAISTPLNIML